MEFIVPAAAGLSGVTTLSFLMYKGLRPYFDVSVNCWFCNTNSKVPFRRQNNFICPHCQQYNGFNEDGDYNCDLPSQYCESLNSPSSRYRQLQKAPQSDTSVTSGLSLGNGLCQTCNLYQAMKVKALADFSPSHPDKYDEEVELYEQRLERLYGGLCRVCTQTLKCTLGEQDSWLKPKLLHWRLKQSTLIKKYLTPMTAPPSQFRCWLSLSLRLLCVFGLLSSLSLGTALHQSRGTAPSNDTVSSAQDGLQHSVMALGSFWCSHGAGITVGLLIALLLAVALAGQRMVKLWDAAGCLLLVFFLTLVAVDWQLLLPSLYLSYLRSFVASLALLSVSCGARSLFDGPLFSKAKPEQPFKRRNLDLSQNSELSAGSFCDSPLGRSFSPQVSTVAPSVANSLASSSGFVQAPMASSSSGFRLKPSSLGPQQQSLDDSLESLNIGASKKPLPYARNAFLSRGPVTTLSSPSSTRSSVNGITQSSWVAGGYWGSPTKSRGPSSLPRERDEMIPPSRSSSQSSGFVSHGSTTNNSQQENLSRPPFASSPFDLDRASVASEGFVWNYETSSQYSQNDLRNRFSTAPGSLVCSDNLSLSPSDQREQLSRTLSRLSQHELSQGHIKADSGGRSPWVAFILGMSVMANGFLALIVFKNETLMQFLS